MIQNKKFVDYTQKYFAYSPQANFSTHDLIFTEGDDIESRISSYFLFTLNSGHLSHSFIIQQFIIELQFTISILF